MSTPLEKRVYDLETSDFLTKGFIVLFGSERFFQKFTNASHKGIKFSNGCAGSIFLIGGAYFTYKGCKRTLENLEDVYKEKDVLYIKFSTLF